MAVPSLFAKRFSDLQKENVLELVALEYPESDLVEYKEFLPGKEGPDPWHIGTDKISQYARDALFSEIVGLANTRGGHLIVGISESEDKPARAAESRPVPRCVELAERLRHASYELIEPRLADFQIAGLPVNDAGDGFIVMRVRESAAAPHRLKPSLEAFVRRGESTQRLTMREIQDLTLQRSRGFSGVDERLAELSRHFRTDAAFIGLNAANIWAGARCSIAPIVPLNLSRVELEPAMHASRRSFTLKYTKGPGAIIQVPVHGHTSRPCLRGYSLSYAESAWHFEHSGYMDGSQHIQIKAGNTSLDRDCLYLTWVLATITSALYVAQELSTRAENPSIEFAVDIQLRSTAPGHASATGHGLILEDSRKYLFGQPELTLPRYSLVPEFSLASLLTLIEADLFNALGFTYDREVVSIA